MICLSSKSCIYSSYQHCSKNLGRKNHISEKKADFKMSKDMQILQYWILEVYQETKWF